MNETRRGTWILCGARYDHIHNAGPFFVVINLPRGHSRSQASMSFKKVI